MKTAYFSVTIPAGSYLVTASTTNGRKLDYLDFFDRAILYRYFAPGAIRVERITGREGARRLRKGARPESFQGLQRFGEYR